MKYALIPGLLLATMFTSAQTIVYPDGSEVVVPEGERIVLVRDDAPVACIEVKILELITPKPDDECGDLVVSPGCNSQQ
jgi:hypothetical protein